MNVDIHAIGVPLAVELMMLGRLGPRLSLHASAKEIEQLPGARRAVRQGQAHGRAAGVLQVLVQASAKRLEPWLPGQTASPACRAGNCEASMRNDITASDKRRAPLRSYQGAAMTAHSLEG